MLFDSLKYPFLTYVNQKYQTQRAVHLLDKLCYMYEGIPRP